MNERFHARRVDRQRVLPWPSCKRRLHLSIHTVICIAGRAHCGYPADERPWVARGDAQRGWGCAGADAAFVPDGASALLGLAGLCWVAAFGLLCWRIGPVLWRVRPDGLWGCQGWGVIWADGFAGLGRWFRLLAGIRLAVHAAEKWLITARSHSSSSSSSSSH